MSGVERLEQRHLLAAAIWHNVYFPEDVLQDRDVSPLDVLYLVNQLNGRDSSSGDILARQLPEPRTGQPMPDVDCDGRLTPLDVLNVVNHINSGGSGPVGPAIGGHYYSETTCAPQLIEGTDLVTEFSVAMTVADENTAIKVSFEHPQFDTLSQNQIRDAFEIDVTDKEGNSLVFPHALDRTSVFNWSESLTPNRGAGVDDVIAPPGTISTATIRLPTLPPSREILVTARLVNNDLDSNTQIILRGFEFSPTSAPFVGATPLAATAAAPPISDWNNLSDVTSSVRLDFGGTSYDESDQRLFSEVGLANVGSFSIEGPLVLVITGTTDPEVVPLGFDGRTRDGHPYFNMSHLLNTEELSSGAFTQRRTISFLNPGKKQFTFQSLVLAEINHDPMLTSDPEAAVEAGRIFRYEASAEDPDGDTLSFRLIVAPQGMQVDAASGLMTWQTTTDQIGHYPVILEVVDGKGGRDVQSFSVNVLQEIPNRPPVFRSAPTVDANVGASYEYQARANDPDGDPLSYSLLAGPSGMLIDSLTGMLRWQPTGAQPGQQLVQLRVVDGRGGVAEQEYRIVVGNSAENLPPIIVSQPVLAGIVPRNPPVGGNPIEQLYRYSVAAVDPDGVALTFSLVESPTAMLIDSQTGLIRWPMTQADYGDHSVRVRVDDGHGGRAEQAFTVRVSDENRPPVIVSPPVTDLFVPGLTNPPTGTVSPQRINLQLDSGRTFEGTVSITLPDEQTRFADIVIAMDESSSMGGAQAWILEAVPLLDAALTEKGIGPNRFAFIGFGGGREGIVAGHYLNANVPTYYSLYGPDNQFIVRGTLNEVFREELLVRQVTKTGEYVLVVEPQRSLQTNESVPVGIVGNLQQAERQLTLELGKNVESRIASPGQKDVYSFQLTRPSLLYFDSLTKDSRISWTLKGPSGTVMNRRFDQSDTSMTNPVMDLPAGPYTLTIEATALTTPLYWFQLQALDASTASVSEPFGVTFEPKNQSQVRRITAAAGDVFQLVPTATNMHDSSRWRLVDTLGRVLIDRPMNEAEPGFLLERGGTYFILLEASHSPKEGASQPRGLSRVDVQWKFISAPEVLPLVLGTRINGQFDIPGGELRYDFELSETKRVYFDAMLANTSALQVSLLGPFGNVFSNVNFHVSDAFGTNTPIATLHPGAYELLLRNNAFTGPFAFNLFDISDSNAIQYGAPIVGQLNPASSTNAYRIEVAAGDKLAIQASAVSQASWARLRWVDPLGRVVWQTNSVQSMPSSSHLLAGTYTLLVEGGINRTGVFDYNLSINLEENVSPAPLTGTPLTLGESIQGQLTEIGQVVSYRFDTAEPKVVYFDALSNPPNSLRWTLRDAGGALIDLRPFIFSDSSHQAQPSVWIPAGKYQLQISASGTFTGSYQFRMLDLAQGTVVSVGNPFSAELTPPSSTNVYRLSVAAGQQLYFHVPASSNRAGAIMRLIDDFGRVAFSTSSLNDGRSEPNLRPGTYSLMIEGTVNSTAQATYTVGVYPSVETIATLELGKAVNVAPQTPGEIGVYTFAVFARTYVHFDSLTNSANHVWNLDGPIGRLVDSRRFDQSDANTSPAPAILLEAGNYRLSVKNNLGSLSAVQFALIDLSAVSLVETATVLSGQHTPTTANHLYRFRGAKGQQLFFDVLQVSQANQFRYRLVDPFGNVLFTATSFVDTQPSPLLADGVYTLMIEPLISVTTEHTYSLKIVPVVDLNSELTFNDLVLAKVPTPGATHHFGFRLDEPRNLAFDSRINSANFSWSLLGPQGAVVTDRRLDQSDSHTQADPILRLPMGDYQLSVSGSGDSVSEQIGFRLMDLTAALAIEPGVPFTNRIDPPNGSLMYRFDATAGDAFFFDFESLSPNANVGSHRLIDPFGRQVFSSTTLVDQQPSPMAVSGTYTLLVEGRINNTTAIDYRMNVQPILVDRQPLVIGQVFSGNLTTAGGQREHTFEIATRARYYIDVQAFMGSSSTLSLTGPSGPLIINQRLDLINAQSNFNPVVDLVPGQYTLSIDATGDTTGAYSFRLVAITDAQAIALGDTVQGTLNPSSSAAQYRFQAQAGDVLRINPLQVTNAGSARMRLINPYGDSIHYDTIRSSTTAPLLVTGEYTLLVEGFNPALAATSFTLQISLTNNIPPNPLQGPALLLGTTTSGQLDDVNPVNHFTLNVPQYGLYYFDSLTNRSQVRWTLTGPRGTLVNNGRFDLSDATERNGKIFVDLAPGNYQLTISRTGTAVEPFSFRFWNVAEAQEGQIAQPIAGDLVPPNESDLYRFQGQAGQRLFVHAEQVSNTTSPVFHIVDPYGNVVLFENGLRAATTNPLPVSGTYTLLLEGRVNNTTASDYGLRLLTVERTSVPLPLNTPVTGQLSKPGDEMLYTFNVSAPAKLIMEPSGSGFTWNLDGPSGNLTNNRAFTDGRQLLDLPPGDYQLLVKGIGNTAGTFVFSPMLVENVPQLALGQPHQGQLTLDKRIEVFRFLATAGEHFALLPDLDQVFVSAQQSQQIVFTLGGDPEDGYSGLDLAFRNAPFRDGAAINYILATDEDRDVLEDYATFERMFGEINQQNAMLNAIVSASFAGDAGNNALGINSEGNSYHADGQGGFIKSPGGRVSSSAVSVRADYIDLAMASGGAAWNLNQLRSGGTSVQSFTEAFIDIKVEEILEQLALNLVASDRTANFQNLTGIQPNIQPGQTASFDVRLTADGTARAFDLLFVQGSATHGSIPVLMTYPYLYDAIAEDPDGDALTWSLVAGPSGLTVDPRTGRFVLPAEQLMHGEFPVTLRVEDPYGGIAEQKFTLSITDGLPGEIHGLKFHDQNDDGLRQENEPTLVGWKLFLDQNRNSILDRGEAVTVTDENGRFSFVGLKPGTYVVTEERRLGWVPTTPAGGTTSIALGNAQIVTDVLFGNSNSRSTNQNPQFLSDPLESITAQTLYRYEPQVVDPDGDLLTFDTPLAPRGMFVDSKTGELLWQPSLDQIGLHNVLLRARDPLGGLALQFLAITVAAPNTAPVITSAFPAGPAGIGLEFHYAAQAIDPDEDALQFQLAAAPASMKIHPQSGSLDWTPAANQLGNHIVRIQVRDGRGGMAEQQFELTVQNAPPNAPPQIASTPRLQVRLGDSYYYQVVATDPNGDRLLFALAQSPAGMTIDQNGLVHWVPEPSQLGIQNVQVVVTDGRGSEARQDFVLEVITQPSNQPPRIVSRPPTGAAVGQLYRFDAQAVDPDRDPLVWDLLEAPLGMTVDARMGHVRWTPLGAQLGSHRVVLRATDPQGATSTLEYSVRVRAINVPPVINSNPPTTASVGVIYLYQARASDEDSDVLQFTLEQAPSGMSIDSRSGLISWTPTAGAVGTQQVRIVVLDGAGGRAVQSYAIEVRPGVTNRPPEIVSSPSFFAGAGQLYFYQVEAVDPEGGPLEYRLLEKPVGMTIDAASGRIEWTPTASQLGTTFVRVLAIDPQGAGSSQTYSLTVQAANRLPQIQSNPITQVTAGGAYRYDVRAADPDGEPLTYRLVQAPTGMLIDGLGRLFWSTSLSNLGTHSVQVRVSDPRGGSAEQAFQLQVVADTQAPQVAIQVDRNPAPLGSRLEVLITSIDNVGVTSLVLTHGGQPVPLDAQGRARITLNTVGPVTLVATARDAAGNVGTKSFELLVFNPNDTDAPRLAITSPSADAIITAPTNIIGSVQDQQLIEYVLSYAKFGNEQYVEFARGTQQIENGILGRFDPTLLPNDTYVIRLTAVDAGGNRAVIEQEVNVAGELKLGNFQLSFVDLQIPVSGIPIAVARIYDTLQADRQGDFGHGWRMELRNADLQVNLPKSGMEQIGIYTPFRIGTRVWVTLPGGQRAGFTFNPSLRVLPGFGGSLVLATPRFTPDPGVTSTLSVGGGQLLVNEFGELHASGGIPWNPASPDFGGAYVLTTRDGVAYRINGSDGKLATVRDRNGNTLTFSDSGVSGPGGTAVSFERDLRGRITAAIDPLGNAVRYAYSAAGDLIRATDREGHATTMTYRSDRAHFLDTVVDPLGRTGIRNEYEASGRLKAIINADGKGIETTFDPNNRIEMITDPLGNITISEYDLQGNVVRNTDALGAVTRTEYDNNNYPTKIVDPLGREMTMVNDTRGFKLSETDARGNKTRYTYSFFGDETSMTDPLGNVTRTEFDSQGNLTSRTDANGRTASIQYSSNGLLERFTGLDGISMTVTNEGSNPGTLSTAGRRPIDIDYDLAGRVIAMGLLSDPTNSETEVVFKWQLDANGRTVREINGQGDVTQSFYDASGNRIRVIDPLGRTTRYEYDFADRLVKTIFPDNTEERIAYDAAGRKISITNRLGRTTFYLFDAVGRQIAMIHPDNTLNDLSDNPTMRTEYDLAGQVTKRIDELGHATSYRYDAAGNEIARTNSLGQTWTMAYDAANRQILSADPLGNATRSIYDGVGNVVEAIAADGSRVLAEYDGQRRLTAHVDAEGGRTEYRYDAYGALIEVTDPLGHRTQYERDERGQATAIIDAEGRRTTFEFDNAGRQLSRTLPDGSVERMVYDAAGQMTRMVDFMGRTTTYTYDVNGRLIRQQFADGRINETAFDAIGQVTSSREGTSITQYTYDVRDRLTHKTDPDGQVIQYTYDVASNLTSTSSIAGIISYTYDTVNRLLSVTDGSEVTRYVYDNAGRQTEIQNANGTIERLEYDPNSRVVRQTLTGPSGTLDDTRTTYDRVGRKLSLTESTGRIELFSYDIAGRLIRNSVDEVSGVDRNTNWLYDAVGNRLRRDDSVSGSTIYQYDIRDRLITEVANVLSTNPITTNYLYDANGNVLSQFDGTKRIENTWDAANRLIESRVTEGSTAKTVRYTYSPDGERYERIEDGETTRFIVDSNREHAVVIAELVNGVVRVRYVRPPSGEAAIAMIRDGLTSTLYTTPMGTTKLVTNASGIVTDRIVVDPFGVVLERTGTTVGLPIYNGEFREALTGYDYLRARFYAPLMGRFVSMDTFAGWQDFPISMNKYVYAHSDPVNGKDPSGFFRLGETLFSSAEAVLIEARTVVYSYAVKRVAKRVVLRKLIEVATTGYLAFRITNPINTNNRTNKDPGPEGRGKGGGKGGGNEPPGTPPPPTGGDDGDGFDPSGEDPGDDDSDERVQKLIDGLTSYIRSLNDYVA